MIATAYLYLITVQSRAAIFGLSINAKEKARA